MEKGYVNTKIENGVGEIEFYHPSHNSLPANLLNDIVKSIRSHDRNPEVRLLLLKSGGDRTFCAGASFVELQRIEDAQSGKEFFMGFANVINAMRNCSKLIVGRVQGKAIGGGVGLISATDYCLANKYASVKLSELAIGIGPFVVGPAIERKVGLAAFSQMAINATEWQTAAWAKEKGLFAEVFPTTNQLDDYTKHFCKTLCGMSPEAMRLLKRIFWENTEDWDELLEKRAEMSGNLILSEFARTAINSFLKS